MKKLSFLLAGLVCISVLSYGQYSVNKTIYNYRDYRPRIGDPYNPGVAGVASVLIPGLGQMLSGETGRGIAFLGGSVGCTILYAVGYAVMSADINEDGYYDGAGSGLVIFGALSMLTVDVWAIADAVRVAKINNMAFWDSQVPRKDVQLQPYLGTLPKQNGLAIGLSLNITF